MESGYAGLKSVPPWGGRDTFSASGPSGAVFLLDAGGPGAAAAPLLFHQNLPEYLGTAELPLPGGPRRFLVYRWFEARPLADALAAGRTFTELEALNAAYEAARALKYLHELSPAAPHGAVGPGGLLLCGARVSLCPPLCSGSPAADIAGLADLMRLLAKSYKRGPFSFQYFKIAEYLRLPGADAAYAIRLMESMAARPMDELPPPKPASAPSLLDRLLGRA